MILRKVICERVNCNAEFIEEYENQGFPNWALLNGFIAKDKDKNIVSLYICPDCKKDLIVWLHGQI